MYESHLEVADPVEPVGGEGSQDDQQTETDEDSDPDLVLACAIADPYFLDEALQSDVTQKSIYVLLHALCGLI